MKRFLKLFPLTLLFCLALALGLAACGESEKSYSVTAEYNADAGSVILSEAGKDADGKYKEGASVTVTVSPKTGYEVSSFSVNGAAETLAGNSYTFFVKEDVKISVAFEKTGYFVTLDKDFEEEMGAASLSAPENGTVYEKDELVTLTVIVNPGFLLEKVTVGSEEIDLNEDGKYSFKIKDDTAIKVTLRAIGYYKTTVLCDETMGSVTVTPAAGANGAYREGTELTLSVTVEYGYKLLSVKVDGSEVTLDENGEYTFAIQKDVTVEAAFDELETYAITFYFDTEMCAMSYVGINEEGKLGDISILPNVATPFYAGETTFTAIPVGGYELLWVEVNGEEVELSDRSFTLDIGEALKDEQGEINVAVFCGFVFTQLDALEGEYELTDDVWYSFTLEEPAVFEFSATNYVAYAAFFVMTQEDDSTWDLDNEHPVWKFNDDGRSNYAINTFEAGSYMARFSSSTGDGSASSKLTVTKIPTFDVEIHESFFGVWKSTDGLYTLTIGRAETLEKNYLILKRDGTTLAATVSRDEEFNDLYISFDRSEYMVMPYGNCVAGTISFVSEEEGSAADVLFLPDPLPTVTIPEEIYGIYSGSDGEENPVDDLTIAGGSIVWGNKTFTPLTEIGLHGMKDPALLSYTDEKDVTHYYLFFCTKMEDAYTIVMFEDTDTENAMLFKLKEEVPEEALGQEYWGRWDCDIYTLNITASSVTLTKNGKEIDVTVGTFTRTLDKDGKFTKDYVSFTFEGKTYYVFTLANGRMNLYPTSGSLNASERMIFIAKFTLGIVSPDAEVTVVDPQTLYEYNTSVHFSVIPKVGYVVTSVKVNGREIAMGEDDVDYHFFIEADSVIAVECAPDETAAAEISPVAFDDALVGTWQNSELKVTIQKNSVALSDGAGNALPHSLRAETYRGRKYNAVVLGETCYLFLKADGT